MRREIATRIAKGVLGATFLGAGIGMLTYERNKPEPSEGVKKFHANSQVDKNDIKGEFVSGVLLAAAGALIVSAGARDPDLEEPTLG